uniref:Uncharacterized protein n=1 Tax=candidate division WOR-3 bacterium TaxID=2052148 RepID=A0A7C4YFU0_UNCW3
MIFFILSDFFKDIKMASGVRIGAFGYDLNSKYDGYFYEVNGSSELFLEVLSNILGFEGTLGYLGNLFIGDLWLELDHFVNFRFKDSSLSLGYGMGVFNYNSSSTFLSGKIQYDILLTSELLIQFQLKLLEHYRDNRFLTSIEISIGAGAMF